jgi:hypothetical protein
MRRVWFGAAVLSLGLGCSFGAPSTRIPPQEEAGAPSSCPTPLGLDCTCPSGDYGKTACQAGVVVCDCSACQQYAVPSGPPVFTACGGDPIGSWALTATDQSHRVVHPNGRLNGVDIECAAIDSQEEAPTQATYTFDAAGTLSYIATTAAGSYRIARACVQRLVPSNQYDGCGEVGCVPATCGLCYCQYEGASTMSSFTWTSATTHLTISGSTGSSAVYDYCVSGDTMTLLFNATRQIFRLQRGGFGPPAP